MDPEHPSIPPTSSGSGVGGEGGSTISGSGEPGKRNESIHRPMDLCSLWEFIHLYTKKTLLLVENPRCFCWNQCHTPTIGGFKPFFQENPGMSFFFSYTFLPVNPHRGLGCGDHSNL